MEAIFEFYAKSAKSILVAVPKKSGSCSFHNDLTIHGACDNITNNFWRAIACAYVPDGLLFNDMQNILYDNQLGKLDIEDVLNGAQQNPLIFSKTAILS